ncbi:MAG: hypothetical protein FWD21_00325, partial [Peptococcaceae bacterium]|nr:hypothetical protein [Peptococcaceae bacterium]
DLHDVRHHVAGCFEQEITVDAVQWAIVQNANEGEGSTGTSWDLGKENALRYTVAGDIKSEAITVDTIGSYYELLETGRSILPEYWCVEREYQYAIGNFYVPALDKAHSVVIRGNANSVLLYDPWSGNNYQYSPEEVFVKGIPSQCGPIIISWLQIIK